MFILILLISLIHVIFYYIFKVLPYSSNTIFAFHFLISYSFYYLITLNYYSHFVCIPIILRNFRLIILCLFLLFYFLVIYYHFVFYYYSIIIFDSVNPETKELFLLNLYAFFYLLDPFTLFLYYSSFFEIFKFTTQN